jgi:hypothetical protein
MAELHEFLVVSLRKRLIKSGFKISKQLTPTYRADIFAEKHSANGRLIEQIVVEAEIKSTLFSEHTTEQLTLMDEFIRHQRAKRVKTHGVLLVPRDKATLQLANSLLRSLFPEGPSIRIRQL